MKLSGLRAIAVLEAGKGVLALLLAIGLHALAGVDLHHQALYWFEQWQIPTSNHYAELILSSIDKVTRSGLLIVTVVVVGYAMIRFVESYGLWQRMRWTEWFAFLSGAVYLPFEIYEVVKDQNLITFGVLGINLIVVAYLFYVLKADAIKSRLSRPISS